jgi:adenosyl cobinamide kinase/adenosyl cobinamide phosphate guanylyltransferase
MATDDEFKTKVRPSDALMRKSFELVGQMHRQLFPAAEQAALVTEGALLDVSRDVSPCRRP